MRFLALFCLFLFLHSPVQAKVETIAANEHFSFLALPSKALPMAVIQLSFENVGAVSDPEDKAGRAFIAANMLMEGTQNLSSLTLRKRLEDHAIDIRVSAGRDNVTLTLQTLTRHLKTAMSLLEEIITQPRFDSTNFATLKRQHLSALKKQSESPGWLASTHFDAYAFGDHPYALPRKGTEKSVAALTIDDLKQWHKGLSQQNMKVSAAGDIAGDTLSATIRNLLSKLPKQNSLPKISPAPEIKGDKAPIIIEQKVPQTVALFGMPSIERNNKDFYAAYVMNHILGGGGLVSRLSNQLRQKHGLVYYASSSLSPSPYSAALYGNFATKNEDALKATKLMQQVLSDFAQKGVSQAEVTNAIDYLTGSFPLALDTLGAQVAYLSTMQRFNLGADYLEKRNDYFRAVTADDINRLAAKILAKPPLVVLVGQPKENAK